MRYFFRSFFSLFFLIPRPHLASLGTLRRRRDSLSGAEGNKQTSVMQEMLSAPPPRCISSALPPSLGRGVCRFVLFIPAQVFFLGRPSLDNPRQTLRLRPLRAFSEMSPRGPCQVIFRNPCATASREIDNLLIEDASHENLPPAGICNEVEEEEEDGGRKGQGGGVYSAIGLLSERLRLYRGSRCTYSGRSALEN